MYINRFSYEYDPNIRNNLNAEYKKYINYCNSYIMPKPLAIEKVIFNDPVTVILWNDKTKTVVRRGEYETYDPEKGMAMAISKKFLGNKGNYYETFKKYLPDDEESDILEYSDAHMSNITKTLREKAEKCTRSLQSITQNFYMPDEEG